MSSSFKQKDKYKDVIDLALVAATLISNGRDFRRLAFPPVYQAAMCVRLLKVSSFRNPGSVKRCTTVVLLVFNKGVYIIWAYVFCIQALKPIIIELTLL
jgi:hypothetical protein